MRDLDSLDSWHSDWTGLRVAVLGLGSTGFSVADTLIELGATVVVVAASATDERVELLSVIGGTLILQSDSTVVPRELTAFEPELVVVSPGYAPDHTLVRWAQSASIPLWGDIELAWRLRDKVSPPAEWILVTGTNGKTTTTQLAAHLLGASGRRAAAVGNIGIPVLDAVRYPAGFDVLVVELSSFQLHWMPRTGVGAVHPLASVCLNVADDHLDWHGSFDAYAETKGTVYANTRVACVYNLADETTMRLVEDAEVEEGCRAIGFGLGSPGPSDVGIVDGILVDRAFHDERHRSAFELSTIDELRQVGLASPHMAANVLAASALVRAAGVAPEDVHDGLLSFEVDHHRMETVSSFDGVVWVDDSKATNPHAANASLTSFSSVVWIVGGLLKGVDLSPLVTAHVARLRSVVVIGEDRQDVVAAFQRHAPDVPLFQVVADDTDEVMPQAVRLAADVARDGDVVLLAPAAASMDQFKDYADRGTRFAEAVRHHAGGAGDDNNPPSGEQGSSDTPT
ncbi:UDP-N-acetylmuramoylalanine--D-glutamate ligase [Microbacteriaceae bacterium SG_E_30_P1]|uniref:UDP-N-acetylmuramoylalanine--D-glutamate ligase n=1 Tax=Antiquaquibacter oligotrophicus TaxID=2880260 RepID=A0ABT6KN04_9MICO|nr:UDP-N-acetylmuramoyl-L-alanine--D-glutamate ligase [Antiquaquibacter oligotrophicus]MDH6180818.1 UDP-N-acetylmuramoylalanine--D-glutamate ligase [Antiquaquibacter oligotrophicus]UDF13465.1 UDP-N-acetylmuramoyl-L-alanine--D-glutamate ligase [Antiquaquibacter oligotrophicus]